MTILTKPQTSAIDLDGGPTGMSQPRSTAQCGRELSRLQIQRTKPAKTHAHRHRVDFKLVSNAALQDLRALLARWLPDGRFEGQEFVARNPRRADRGLGSFKVNVRTGRWADFATGDRGGDAVSLAAYLFGLSQIDAARKLARMLGLPGGEVQHD